MKRTCISTITPITAEISKVRSIHISIISMLQIQPPQIYYLYIKITILNTVNIYFDYLFILKFIIFYKYIRRAETAAKEPEAERLTSRGNAPALAP